MFINTAGVLDTEVVGSRREYTQHCFAWKIKRYKWNGVAVVLCTRLFENVCKGTYFVVYLLKSACV